MINTITQITAKEEFENIALLEQDKKYRISFKIDKESRWPWIHLHGAAGKCTSIVSPTGDGFLPNKTYKYIFKATYNGDVAVKAEKGTTIYDIVVEEVV